MASNPYYSAGAIASRSYEQSLADAQEGRISSTRQANQQNLDNNVARINALSKKYGFDPNSIAGAGTEREVRSMSPTDAQALARELDGRERAYQSSTTGTPDPKYDPSKQADTQYSRFNGSTNPEGQASGANNVQSPVSATNPVGPGELHPLVPISDVFGPIPGAVPFLKSSPNYNASTASMMPGPTPTNAAALPRGNAPAPARTPVPTTNYASTPLPSTNPNPTFGQAFPTPTGYQAAAANGSGSVGTTVDPATVLSDKTNGAYAGMTPFQRGNFLRAQTGKAPLSMQDFHNSGGKLADYELAQMAQSVNPADAPASTGPGLVKGQDGQWHEIGAETAALAKNNDQVAARDNTINSNVQVKAVANDPTAAPVFNQVNKAMGTNVTPASLLAGQTRPVPNVSPVQEPQGFPTPNAARTALTTPAMPAAPVAANMPAPAIPKPAAPTSPLDGIPTPNAASSIMGGIGHAAGGVVNDLQTGVSDWKNDAANDINSVTGAVNDQVNKLKKGFAQGIAGK